MPPHRRFLDQFQVLLLDMNGTFMFGGDCFGEFEDFFSTYRSLGGDRLGLGTVWVTTGAPEHPLADRVIPSLLTLEALPP